MDLVNLTIFPNSINLLHCVVKWEQNFNTSTRQLECSLQFLCPPWVEIPFSCWWLPSSCMVMSMLSKFCALSCRCVSISHMKLNSEFSPMYLLLIIFVTATPTYYRGVNIPSLKAPTDVAWCVWLKAWSSLQKKPSASWHWSIHTWSGTKKHVYPDWSIKTYIYIYA